jgi:hypothetical protein
MKNIKKIIFYLGLIISFMSINGVKAQTISPLLFGQNAWMPDSIGSQKYYGKFETKWPEVKASGTKTIRYGGIGADRNNPTKYQYIKMIDAIRANGMEPIMQVSFDNWRFTAAQAAEIVKYVNITMGRNVKYWSIGNEPDLGYDVTSAAQLCAYFKGFASAMKKADPTIKIMGPETAWYNTSVINGLTTAGGADDITGKDANGNYYLDILSFHAYPFNGSQTRSSVLTALTSSGNFNDDLAALNVRLAACNAYHGRTGANAVKSAVTEANINYQNSSSDNLYGVGAMSFIGGQFWAEMLGIAMKHSVEMLTFWSVIEGNSTALNIGFINKDNGNKQPTYHHYKMIADNFRGTYADGTDNQANVKAFGSKDGSQISVIILNEDQASNFNYTVRLNTDAVSGNDPLKVNINAGVAKEYTGVINNQSTTLLIFDAAGNVTKKIEYKLNGHADANLAPTETIISGGTNNTVTATITPAGATTFAQGGSVVLNANTGSNYTYQWKKDGANISGATGASYTATASGSYSVVVSNGTSTATSAAVTVTVTTSSGLRAVITAAGPTTFAQGGSVVLNANTGAGYAYQWKKDGANIAGATGASYTATAAGSYVVAITSGGSTVVSAAVVVTVTTSLTATITVSGSTTVPAGGSVMLYANTGSGYVYQWKKDGVAISGATTSSLKVTASGSYQVKITSGSNVAWSAPVTITVSGVTGVKNEIAKADGILQVKTYPNPTNGPLNIELSTAEILEGKVDIQLINTIGQVVMSRKVDVSEGVVRQSMQLDPSLAAGTYMIRVIEGKFITINRIVVSR